MSGMGSMNRVRLASLALIVGLAPAIAGAQINPFRGIGANRLSNDDVQMLTDASNRLLARTPLPLGSSEEWKNDRTGASGSVAVTSTLRLHGLPCHALRYRSRSAASAPTRSGTLTWCKVRDGSWKIAS